MGKLFALEAMPLNIDRIRTRVSTKIAREVKRDSMTSGGVVISFDTKDLSFLTGFLQALFLFNHHSMCQQILLLAIIKRN
jgi:hypothetical protein